MKINVIMKQTVFVIYIDYGPDFTWLRRLIMSLGSIKIAYY